MKVLIVSPSFSILGGVANHYSGLAPYWTEKVFYAFYGKRRNLPAIACLLPDFFLYIIKLLLYRIDVVIINPSFRSYQLKRDGIYLLIAKVLGKDVVTFVHGWDYSLYERIKEKPRWFRFVYGRSRMVYVLYSEFKKSLEQLLPNVPIVLSTTKVADSLLDGFDISCRQSERVRKLLFLARAEKTKGLDVTIRAFELLQKGYSDLELSICGEGSFLQEAKNYVHENAIKNVVFHGVVEGEKKFQEFSSSHIYILPSHEEGMATSVLEAMAFGLVILSRPVGGINDFFENEKMGYLLDSLCPEDYAKILKELIDNPTKVRDIAYYNHTYAVNHFLASKVVEKMEADLRNYIG